MDLDLEKGWWTPPLAPLDAYTVEFDPIHNLGLKPMVSLTDHDDIEAPMSLQAIDATRKVPVSVEWTVPLQNTFVHLGVHNLPALRARSILSRLKEFTAKPSSDLLKELLSGLHSNPGTLIVFNHPMWDEKGVGFEMHRAAILELLGQCGEFIDALELNGLRPWSENRQAMLLGQAWSKPVISGGDRHAIEPNAVLNLTRALTFSEFAAEIRSGHSDVLITPRYREAHATRILQNIMDVLGTYEAHGLGWREWPDRVFYQMDDSAVKSLAQIWGSDPPLPARALSGGLRFAGRTPLRQALRAVAARAHSIAL